MAKVYQATSTFGEKWSAADSRISIAVKTAKRIPFYIHELASTVEEALKGVKIDDVIGDIVPKWKKKEPSKVIDICPGVQQGYHGISLEKAIKARYEKEFMKNALSAYTTAATRIEEVSQYEKRFPESAKL